MIGCDCAVCRSLDPRNQRLRPSLYVEAGNTRLLVDATPDFRTQALRANIRQVDAVLVTHTHADHVLGLDDLRAFTERDGRPMPIHGSKEALARIQEIFAYACTDKPKWASLPCFSLQPAEPYRAMKFGELEVLALPVEHGRLMVYAYRFGREIAYVTDCNAIPAASMDALRGVNVLILDALRHRPHPTHLTIAQAVEVAHQLKPKLTLLTHMCHEVEHAATERDLPADVRLAYDGLQIEVEHGEVAGLV
jgi:phosphoribosyl 1,2-cyclic phosphate phosphodiesterase